MIFGDIPSGATVFLDCNTFVYHFSSHPSLGKSCRALIERVTQGEILALTSSHVLTNTAHRLMTIEACEIFNWPYTGIAQRLNQHHSQIPQLKQFRIAVEHIPRIGVQVAPVTSTDVIKAAEISQAAELLSNDALIVAIMQRYGLTMLASHDSDFDRVAGLTRYAPA